MQGKKIYYEKASGNVILVIGEASENTLPTSVEQDIATYRTLSERNRETFGVIELPHGAYIQDFAECNGYRVNPDTLTLEFSYPDPNLPPNEQPEPVYQKPLSEQVKELETRTADIELALADILLGGM